MPPRNPSPQKSSLPWYKKDLAIKNNEAIAASIEAFLAKHPEKQPVNTKELLVKLLEIESTSMPAGNLEAERQSINEEREKWQKEKEELEATHNIEKEQHANQIQELNGKLDGLQADNIRLTGENTALTEAQTNNTQYFTSLQKLAPSFYKPEDKTIEASLGRFLFVIEQLSTENNGLHTKITELNALYEAERNKPPRLASGQAVVSFNTPQLETIKLVRQLLEAAGHRFTSNEPGDVIHAALDEYIKLLRNYVAQFRDVAPLAEIIQ